MKNYEEMSREELIKTLKELSSRENIKQSANEHTQDITERKKAEEALQQSEAKFRSYIKNAPWGIFVADEKGNYLEINDAACKITGYSSDELLSMNLIELIPPEEHLSAKKHFETAVKTGISTGDLSFIKKDRSINIWTVDAVKLSDNRFLGFVIDITERKKADAALGESEERYRTLFEKSMDAIFLAEADTGIILDCNEKALELFERTREELIGQHQNILHPPEELTDGFSKTFIEHREEKSGQISEAKTITKSGKIKYVEIKAYPFELKEKKLIQGIFRDITGHKQAEEEQRKLQDQLLQAQKMESVGRLAGGVAHDFNNILGIILGLAEIVLYDVAPTDPIAANLEAIRKAGKRAADLTRQLLAFARKQTIAPKVIELNETVGGMLKMLSRLIGEDIDLNWKPASNLEPVKMDPTQIDQILVNLLVNARDAIAGVGKITIETDNAVFDEDYCTAHTDSVPGEYVMLAVSDNGCGMDRETLANIFEPFFTTKEFGKGTGLGLATVYGIVRQNNGFINVYSEPGAGTTFRIYLPRYADKTASASKKGPVEAATGGTETVLLVEDEADLLNMNKAMLERLGYTVLAAGTTGEAIRLAEKHAGGIHLLMTDVVMPDMNGRDLANQLLSLYPNLKRLFMSGYTANIIAHHGVLDKGVHFIQKPFSMKELTTRVREALEQK